MQPMRRYFRLGPVGLGIHAEKQEHHATYSYGEWRAGYMETETDTSSIRYLHDLGLLSKRELVRPLSAWYFRIWLSLGTLCLEAKATTKFKPSGPDLDPNTPEALEYIMRTYKPGRLSR